MYFENVGVSHCGEGSAGGVAVLRVWARKGTLKGAGPVTARAAAVGVGTSRKMRSSNWLADDLLMKAEKGSVWHGSVGSGAGGVAVRAQAWGGRRATGAGGAVVRAACVRAAGVGKGRRRCAGMTGE